MPYYLESNLSALKGELNIASEMFSGQYSAVSHFVFRTKNYLFSDPLLFLFFFLLVFVHFDVLHQWNFQFQEAYALCYSEVNVVVTKGKCDEQTECDNQGKTKPIFSQFLTIKKKTNKKKTQAF